MAAHLAEIRACVIHLFVQEAPRAHKLVGEADPASSIKRKRDHLPITIKGVAPCCLQVTVQAWQQGHKQVVAALMLTPVCVKKALWAADA